ncbi:RnfH family protein [Dokdonella sp.]|uniref:RnfH family protein n=1 Tax=Dokdonella sp. TaxID=2291710 RepID=UPI003C55D8A8
MASERIRIEVAYATPDVQFLRSLELNAESTVADAIAKSGVENECEIRIEALTVGIWSKPATLHTCLRDGDRVEIYRPLKIDPMEARRLRARNSRRRGVNRS